MSAADLLLHLRAAGLRLDVEDGVLLVGPASLLRDDDRNIIRAHKAELLALLNATPASPNRAEVPLLQADSRPYRLSIAESDAAHADTWDDGAIARFQARTRHIRRLGFTEQDGDDLAERLHLRDVHANYRHLCVECRHFRPHRCGNHRTAGLTAADVGRDLATMFQDCPGFSEVL